MVDYRVGQNQTPAPTAATQAPSLQQNQPGLLTNLAGKVTSGFQTLKEAAAVPIKLPIIGKHLRMPFISNPPEDPLLALDEITQLVEEFEKIQGSLPSVQPPLPAAPQAQRPSLTSIEEETGAALTKLSNHVSDFSILYALHWAVGKTDDADIEAIFDLTRHAEDPNSPTARNLKQLFFARYQELSAIQKLKVHVLYFLCTLWGLVQKTVDAYFNKILQEMRSRLANGMAPTTRNGPGELIPNLIEDGIEFLKTYRQAIVNHAKRAPLTGLDGNTILNPSLRQYKEISIEKMFGKSLNEFAKDTAMKIIQLAPKVAYRPETNGINKLINRFMNWTVSFFLEKNLPGVLQAAVTQSTEATRPHKLPFVKALTKGIIEQIKDLDTKTQGGLSRPEGSFPGAEDLKEFVDQLFNVLEFGENPTRREVLRIHRSQELSSKDSLIEATIKGSCEKALHTLLHYLSEQNTTEKMFTNFFELLDIPFTLSEVVTAADVELLNDELSELSENVFKRLVKDEIEEFVMQTPPQTKVDAWVNEQFKTRKQEADAAFNAIANFMPALRQKIESLPENPQDAAAIQTDLEALKGILKEYTVSQKLLPKNIDFLPAADQQTIAAPLSRIYKQAAGLMRELLSLKQLLQEHTIRTRAFALSSQFKLTTESLIGSKQLAAQAVDQLVRAPEHASRTEIIAQLKQTVDQMQIDRGVLQSLHARIAHLLSETENENYARFLRALEVLEEESLYFLLLQTLNQNLQRASRRDAARNIFSEIIEQLNTMTTEDQRLLRPLISNLRRYRGESLVGAKQQIADNMGQIQERIIQAMNAADREANETASSLTETNTQRENGAKQRQEEIALQMKKPAETLNKGHLSMGTLAKDSEKERQRTLSPAQLDHTLGVGVGVAGSAIGYFLGGPVLGGVAGWLAGKFARPGTVALSTDQVILPRVMEIYKRALEMSKKPSLYQGSMKVIMRQV